MIRSCLILSVLVTFNFSEYKNLDFKSNFYTNDEQIIISFLKGRLKMDSVNIYPKKTPFYIQSASESVIAANYIKGFSYANSANFKNKKTLIKKVEDSLQNRSKVLNKECNSDQKESVNSNVSPDKSHTIFFSCKCENTIYCEVINTKGIRQLSEGFDLSGDALTFVFIIKNGKIVNFYHGRINYN